ncbi:MULTISPECIES: response regulator transcription factor [Emticicia]|uniref:response regulator transcription factor n=1 Tax=Emticicia TaxID=312278 RepID=UPI000C795307|nr:MULTISPECIES: response regulator transcription factor [Emticicia]PLK45251.1 DNA-binding response regulator [Emticicia sp. TH156]UTA67243.1 response regulator transcription factor [Emticicia sp. 21SJ11W-3]
MISVLLFEDNKNLRESLSLYLSGTDGLRLAGAYPEATDAVKLVSRHQPDVVLMDIQMPQVSGIEAMIAIKKVNSDVKVLIQTVFENDDKVFAAICAGANGYILKTPKPENYVKAIFDVYNGGSHLTPSIAAKVLAMFQNQFVMKEQTYVSLTPREKEVLQLMVKGMSYKMIADACNVSFNTIHTHIKNIYEKLHVNSAPEAVVKALSMRLV